MCSVIYFLRPFVTIIFSFGKAVLQHLPLVTNILKRISMPRVASNLLIISKLILSFISFSFFSTQRSNLMFLGLYLTGFNGMCILQTTVNLSCAFASCANFYLIFKVVLKHFEIFCRWASI